MMPSRRRCAAAATGALFAVLMVPVGVQAQGVPANVVAFTPSSTADNTYSTVQYGSGGSQSDYTTSWRVVNGLGNGAEKFLDTTPAGQILDLGGRYLNLSADGGATWSSVQPQNPLVNAEGAVASAPNGDIVGVTWDPYGGDTLYSYKYDAASKQWQYSVDPHTPFYDRPEIAVLPGPFTIPAPGGVGAPTVVPYLSFVSSHGSPMFYATDGLNYENQVGVGAAVTQWIPTTPDPSLDWGQTQVWSPMRALGGGWALDFSGGGGAEDYSLSDNLSSNSYFLFSPVDLSLHPLALPSPTTLSSNMQVDSQGRIHEVLFDQTDPTNGYIDGFTYRMSADGGRTWTATAVHFPAYEELNSNTGGQVIDLRVDAALHEAAVNTRTDVGSAQAAPVAGDPEQDYVYKFDISGSKPTLARRYTVGLGNNTVDTAYLGTYETSGHRYDFATMGILPDGRIVTSFMDESTSMPFPTTNLNIVASAVAIEGTSTPVPINTPEAPWVALFPLGGSAAVAAAVVRRRRRGVLAET